MSLERPRQPNPEEDRVEQRTYNLDSGTVVGLSAREFVMPEKEGNPEAGTIFLPGWSMGAQTESARKLGQAFANSSLNSTYAVSTRAEAMHETDTLLEEAKAIAQFIKEKGLKEVTLAGHSQGGDKAINVAALLQADPDMQVKGLVLIDSTGLYDQTKTGLAAGFTKDSMVSTPPTLANNLIKNRRAAMHGVRASADIMFGIAKEVWRSKLKYYGRLKAEIREMAAANPRLAELEVPIVLLSGASDPVSHPEKIIPPGEEAKILEAWEQEEESEEKKKYIDPREEFLRENLFPKSPYIRMVVPEKFGHHGLPLFRSRSVARASLYLLKRFHRREKVAEQQ